MARQRGVYDGASRIKFMTLLDRGKLNLKLSISYTAFYIPNVVVSWRTVDFDQSWRFSTVSQHASPRCVEILIDIDIVASWFTSYGGYHIKRVRHKIRCGHQDRPFQHPSFQGSSRRRSTKQAMTTTTLLIRGLTCDDGVVKQTHTHTRVVLWQISLPSSLRKCKEEVLDAPSNVKIRQG